MSSGKKITSTDVARAAGCSQSTVSKVMNNHSHVSEFLRQKVVEQARKLNYHLMHGKLQRVALILPSPWRFRLDGYVSALLNALVYVLNQQNIRMEIVLENDAEFVAKFRLGDAADIPAVDQDGTFIRIIKPQQQIDEFFRPFPFVLY